MRAAVRFLLALAIGTAAVGAPPLPRIPRDAPICAPPFVRPLFISPMGEPFRGVRGAPWPSVAWFARADDNGDGVVDRAEFAADARRFFATLDRDRDGRLTPEEIDRYEREVAPEIALYAARGPDDRRERDDDGEDERARGRRDGTSGYGGPLGAGRFAWLNIPEPVAAADADLNRVVDAQEFAAAAMRRFDALDRAHDGRLRPLDMPPTPLQMRIEGPCRPPPRHHSDPRDERSGDAPPMGRPR